MNRVEDALQKGRCVIAFGGRTLAEDGVLAELRRRSGIPSVVLGGDPVDPAQELSEAALGPATGTQGGIVILIEPDAAKDGRALEALGGLLKAARNKPRVHVVARSFNPFLLPMSMRLMKLDQHKMRAKDFMARLPMVGGAPVAAAAAPEPEKKKKERKGPPAPKTEFIGREDELAALTEALAEGGSTCIVGARGSGRTWLIEQALSTSELTRLPDFQFEDGSGYDALVARLVEFSGDDDLKRSVRSGKVAPMDQINGLLAALDGEAFANAVMVFRNLRFLQHPDGSIARRDRISLLVLGLLTRRTGLRVLFVTDRKPALYGDGETAKARVLELEGLKGKELYPLWESYHAGEVDRGKMGEVHNATGGHPLATRAFAIAWRDGRDDGLIDGKKFMRLDRGLEPLERHLQRRVEKLPKELADALARAGHSAFPIDGKGLSELGLNRNIRLELASRGLLEALPATEPRQYRVHPIVRRTMSRRALSDFDLLERLAGFYRQKAHAAEGVHSLAWHQRANRELTAARRRRGITDNTYPENDAALDAVRGILRNPKNPRYDIALQIIRPVRKRAPLDPEARCLEGWVLHFLDKHDEAEAAFASARAECPTPEVFHAEAGWRLERRRKGDVAKALEVLAAGSEAFPQDGTLLRRRAAILQVEQDKYAEAEALLRASLEVEPGSPEAWSRLGEVLLAQGPDKWEDADQAIRYALGIEPDRPTHRYRLARLQRRRALAPDAADRAALQAEAKELLEDAVRARPREPGPYLELAQLLLEMNQDLERADWCVGKANKIRKTPTAQVLRARVLARMGRAVEAEAAIARLMKQKGAQHLAHAAMSELYFAQKKVFMADQELHKAIQLAPEGSLEIQAYQREKVKLEALIASGAAMEMEKQADVEHKKVADAAAEEVKTTHDRGTVVRRRGGKTEEVAAPAPEPAAEPVVEAAPEEPVAEEPAAEEPVAEEPAAEEPAAEEPAADAVEPEPSAEV